MIESLHRRRARRAHPAGSSISALTRLRRQRLLLILTVVGLCIALGHQTARASVHQSSWVYRDPKGYRALHYWPRHLRSKAYRVITCESHRNYRAVSRSGRYRGAWQFSQSAWNSAGGPHTGDGVRPDRASRYAQDLHAYKLYRARGWSPWPVCGRR